MNNNSRLIVDTEVLPEIFLKVKQIKDMLSDGSETSTSEACKKAGVSRSAYYKYKDHIFDFDETSGNIVTLHAVLSDRAGILSMFMSVLYDFGANILTVNQNIPTGARAPVSVSFRTKDCEFSVNDLIDKLKQIDGVKSVHRVLGE